jgi:hypothetical protein
MPKAEAPIRIVYLRRGNAYIHQDALNCARKPTPTEYFAKFRKSRPKHLQSRLLGSQFFRRSDGLGISIKRYHLPPIRQLSQHRLAMATASKGRVNIYTVFLDCQRMQHFDQQYRQMPQHSAICRG